MKIKQVFLRGMCIKIKQVFKFKNSCVSIEQLIKHAYNFLLELKCASVKLA